MVTKTIRRNRVKLEQLKRKIDQAQQQGNWALFSELETKFHILLRRLGRV